MVRKAMVGAFLGLATAISAGAAMGQAKVSSPVIAAVVETDAIPLYGERTPGRKDTETWFKWYEGQVVSVRNVTYPTLTPVLPDPAKATGAAVVVAPGGAFEFLSMEHEGWTVARALADRGVAAFVLKYRTKSTPADQQEWLDKFMRLVSSLSGNDPAGASKDAARTRPADALDFPPATADALAALSLVRANAARWNIDPRHVGMIGFSAGSAATLSAALAAKPGQGPAFIGLIYGPLGRVAVPPQAPPLFAARAIDDPLFEDLPLIDAWHKAGRPVELHLYQTGGHGFGLGRPGTTHGMLMDQFMTWMSMQGFNGGDRAGRPAGER